MVANLTVPRIRVRVQPLTSTGAIIATLDVTMAIRGIEIRHAQQTAQSGWLPWTALIQIDGKRVIPGVSFNPRDMSATPRGAEIWSRGTRVLIEVADSADALRAFPDFYIIDHPVRDRQRQLSLRCVDGVAIADRLQAEGDESGITLGTVASRTAVFSSIVSSFSSLPVTGTLPGSLSAPLQKLDRSSFVSQSGAVAWTANPPHFAWVDNTNTIRLTQLDFNQASPGFTVDTTTDAAECADINSDERPPSTVRVAGTVQELGSAVNPRTVELIETDGEAVSLRERRTETIGVVNVDSVDINRSLQRAEVNPGSTSTVLVLAEIIRERRNYLIFGDERLVSITRTERRSRGLLGLDTNPFVRVPAFDQKINYEYGSDAVVRKITRELRLSEVLMNEASSSDTLKKAEMEIQTWEYLGGGAWESSRILKRARILIDPDTGSFNPYALVVAESEVLKGPQANPPATEFKKREEFSEERLCVGEANFAAISGLFQDQVEVIELPGGLAGTDADCAQLAGFYGNLAYGRSLALALEVEVIDWYLQSYSPYTRVDVTDDLAVTTVYLLDGSSLQITSDDEGALSAKLEIGLLEVGILT